MSIVHVPFGFYPDPAGGTEIYVESLAREQQARGAAVVVAAPAAAPAAYEHAGLAVRRFALGPLRDVRAIYDEGDLKAAVEFGHILDAERATLVHLHAFTRGASLAMVRAARQRHIPVVFTYHTPMVSCVRGSLMRWGDSVCDGDLATAPCGACMLDSLGLSGVAGRALGRVPVAFGRGVEALGRQGGAWTALRMTSLVGLRHASFHSLVAEVTAVVAVCDWVRALLLRNGVLPEKITLSRQGLSQDPPAAGRLAGVPGAPLRVAYLGRLHATKGPATLIQALRARPDATIALDVYGIAQDSDGAAHLAQLRSLAGADRRVRFLPAVPAAEVVMLLAGYDLLAVPSRCLETGPLVVLEAFAAGIPVLGSALGGIAELVCDGVDGLLVESGDIAAWAAALARLSADPALLARLQNGVRPPRRMATVAEEMLALYRCLQPLAATA